MNHIVGQVGELGWVAAKAALLFATAVAALRMSRRRTMAEMSAFDFVAAVAIGAIVGRVPNSSKTSFVEGAVTLVTILVVHSAATSLRFRPSFAKLMEHSPRLLVAEGEIKERALHRAGMTHDDLYALLRQRGVTQLDQVRFVIFERRGDLSVITKEQGDRLPLVDEAFKPASRH